MYDALPTRKAARFIHNEGCYDVVAFHRDSLVIDYIVQRLVYNDQPGWMPATMGHLDADMALYQDTYRVDEDAWDIASVQRLLDVYIGYHTRIREK